MKTFADRLSEALTIRRIKPVDFAKAFGLDRTQISRYTTGRSLPRYDRLEAFAKYLNVSPDWLNGTSDRMEVNNVLNVDAPFRKIPVYAPISCGLGSYEDGQIIDYIGIPESRLRYGKKYFGQYAKGDSMTGAGIEDGDLLVFEACEWIDQGKIGVFCIDEDTAVCKRFTIGADKCVYLMSANDKYPPIRVDQTCECFRIVGRLVSVVKAYD